MEEITVSAKTLDDAITEASVQLGVTSDHLDYEVIEKGSSGFLGIGAKQAVIRAKRKKREAAEEEIVREERIKEEKKADKKEEGKKKNREKVKNENKKPAPQNNKKADHEEKKKEINKPAKEENKKLKEETELVKVEDATIAACEKFVADVLKAMDMEVEITSSIDEEGSLNIDLNGKNMGILIGKRGQTLDALQYLTNRIANKSQSGYVRVKIDTEDYRRRRKETLENLARNIAHKVKRTRKAVSLEPMNPYERRIIHSALQGDKAVNTHSEGEEPYRYVVVTLNRK